MKVPRYHCSACGVKFEKPKSDHYCKPCGAKRAAKYREDHPEKHKAATMRWRRANAARYKKVLNAWRKKNKARYAATKERSRKKRLRKRRPIPLPAHPSCRPDHKHCTRRSCRALVPLGRKDKFCKACRAEYSRNGRNKSEESRQKHCGRVRRWSAAHPDEKASHYAKRRAREKGAAGSHTVEEWNRLLEERGLLCAYCGCTLTKRTATRDHVRPLSRGGSDDIGNIVPACRRCNLRKHALDVETFAKRIGKHVGKSLVSSRYG